MLEDLRQIDMKNKSEKSRQKFLYSFADNLYCEHLLIKNTLSQDKVNFWLEKSERVSNSAAIYPHAKRSFHQSRRIRKKDASAFLSGWIDTFVLYRTCSLHGWKWFACYSKEWSFSAEEHPKLMRNDAPIIIRFSFLSFRRVGGVDKEEKYDQQPCSHLHFSVKLFTGQDLLSYRSSRASLNISSSIPIFIVDNRLFWWIIKYLPCRSHTTSNDNQCLICGSSALGMNFGVLTCAPCKGTSSSTVFCIILISSFIAFFRRNARRKEVPPLFFFSSHPYDERFCLAAGSALPSSNIRVRDQRESVHSAACRSISADSSVFVVSVASVFRSGNEGRTGADRWGESTVPWTGESESRTARGSEGAAVKNQGAVRATG